MNTMNLIFIYFIFISKILIVFNFQVFKYLGNFNSLLNFNYYFNYTSFIIAYNFYFSLSNLIVILLKFFKIHFNYVSMYSFQVIIYLIVIYLIIFI